MFEVLVPLKLESIDVGSLCHIWDSLSLLSPRIESGLPVFCHISMATIVLLRCRSCVNFINNWGYRTVSSGSSMKRFGW